MSRYICRSKLEEELVNALLQNKKEETEASRQKEPSIYFASFPEPQYLDLFSKNEKHLLVNICKDLSSEETKAMDKMLEASMAITLIQSLFENSDSLCISILQD
jgi:hypothetical protein